jgi:hypothetical protein
VGRTVLPKQIIHFDRCMQAWRKRRAFPFVDCAGLRLTLPYAVFDICKLFSAVGFARCVPKKLTFALLAYGLGAGSVRCPRCQEQRGDTD